MTMNFKVFLLNLLLICQLAANHIHDWDYGEHGPAVWSELYSTCGGEHQSPINILTACTNYSSIPQFNFSYGYNELHNFTLTNNGHTIVGTYNNESKLPTFRIQGGGLNGTYEFVNFHLHWGENHKSGSEHEINGESYPGEIHFVYHNALVNHNAVLGIFMRSLYPSNQTYASNLTVSDEKTQKEWRKFFNQTQTLIQEDNSTVMSLNLAFLMGQNFDEFWRYEGSLTTPPCTENVLWTLFRKPIVFGEDEFESFRQHVYFEDYRRPQPLYTRSVYRNFHNEILSSIPDYNYCQGKSIEQQMSNKITNIHDSIHWVLFLFLIFIKTFSIV